MDTFKWFLLDPQGQPQGPYQTSGMAGLLQKGHIDRDTLCWCDGRTQWQCAKDIAELDAAFGTIKGIPGASEADAARNDPLDAFKQEIEALENKTDGATAGSLGLDVPKSPDEKSFIDDDGTEYTWDSVARKYKSNDFDASVNNQSAAVDYDISAMTYEADEDVVPSLAEAQRQQEEALNALEEESLQDDPRVPKGKETVQSNPNDDTNSGGEKRKPDKLNASEPSKTTSVYITGLPDDVTIQEVVTVFSKCGIIRQGDDNTPKIKLYRDKASGMLKGDGLVTYLKRPSVELATNILDGTPFRPGMAVNMKVQEARFELKGEYKPPTKPKKKPKKSKGDRRQETLLGWGGFDDRLPASKITVIMKHMFHPNELTGQPQAHADLEEDIKEECGKLGPVDKITIYEKNPEGVISVRFESEEAADLCVQRMNGRYFAGRELKAEKWDGFTKYMVKPEESEEAQAARLEQFSKDIEAA